MTELKRVAFGKKITIAKQGWAEIGGKRCFFRSGWEANIAAYLQFLKERGQIKEWYHEPETFYYNRWYKRGTLSYLPDFKVILNDGTVEFWEVKGFLDSKSKTKMNRFNKHYPCYKLHVISKQRYTAIAKNKALFRFWGLLQ